MKVRTSMNKGAIRQLSAAQIQALKMTADALKTEVMNAAVVPKQSGELERSAHIDESRADQGLVKLVYDTPYARRLYFHPELNFRTDKNANAHGKWLEHWIIGGKKDFAAKAFRKIYRMITRGTVR
ncbi:hypothetical protein [Cohnella abietis]|uniref:Minor capsid protein n=1 Tax=Cohnella abietis TaxID=2507935 RepID=A0A3T1D2X9_9BACL|nr:hypothetical protein [Cohnella abietis]BBI32365.1 hypothetical protein KCTCHS21_17640 [Cohnella abietis]